MIRRFCLVSWMLVALACCAWAQESLVSEGIGHGIDIPSATRAAKRDALSKALGEEIKAWSKVENFALVADVIISQSNGHVQVLSSLKPVWKENVWEVRLKCKVKRDPKSNAMILKALEANKESAKKIQEHFGHKQGIIVAVDEGDRVLLKEMFLGQGYRVVNPSIAKEQRTRILEHCKELAASNKGGSKAVWKKYKDLEPYEFIVAYYVVDGTSIIQVYSIESGEVYAVASNFDDVVQGAYRIFRQMAWQILDMKRGQSHLLVFANFQADEMLAIRKHLFHNQDRFSWIRLKTMQSFPKHDARLSYLEIEVGANANVAMELAEKVLADKNFFPNYMAGFALYVKTE